MKKKATDIILSPAEIKKLQDKVLKLEKTLHSIQSGEVDAFIINDKEGIASVFTLEGADQPYRILVESMSAGAITLNSDGKIIHSNKQFCEMVKIPVKKLINTSIFDYIPKKQHDFLKSLFDPVKKQSGGKFTLQAIDGSIKTVLFASHNVEFGDVDGISIVVTDISAIEIERIKRKKIRKKLTKSETLFRQFAENIKEVFWSMTPLMNQLVYVSPAYEEIWGRSSANLISNPYEWMDAVIDEDKEKVKLFIADLIKNESASVEYRIRRPDGQIKIIFSKGFQVKNEEGKIINIIGVAADMTEFSELKIQAHLNDKLTTIGALAAGIAHEINNPVMWILGNLEYIKKNGASVDREKLDELLNESIHGAELIRDIVMNLKGYARIDENEITPIDLEQIIDSALSIASADIKLRAHVVTDYAKNLPLVKGSSGKLHQVFLNLIMNASQAIPEGDPQNNTISIATIHDNKFVRIDISDTGSGIRADNLSKIFDPFYTSKQRTSGTGLGLSISLGIIKNLGGSINVKSTPGKGSTFSVCLPVSDSDHIASCTTAHASTLSPPVTRKRILLVDDELYLLKSIQRMLEDIHDVSISSSGQSAINLLKNRENKFDIILSDLNMPEINGADLYHFMALNFPGLEHRIIFMTGGVYTVTLQSFLAGVNNLQLTKPFTQAELLAVIERVYNENANR